MQPWPFARSTCPRFRRSSMSSWPPAMRRRTRKSRTGHGLTPRRTSATRLTSRRATTGSRSRAATASASHSSACSTDPRAATRRSINDAPRPSGEEDVVWDAALVRDLEAALERRDRDMRVTVAVDERGEVVAFTELRVSRALGATAGTEDTAVLASHRRRGLGRWVKLESLRRLERDRPDVPLVATMNAEENRAMLELDRAVGFSPVAVYTSS